MKTVTKSIKSIPMRTLVLQTLAKRNYTDQALVNELNRRGRKVNYSWVRTCRKELQELGQVIPVSVRKVKLPTGSTAKRTVFGVRRTPTVPAILFAQDLTAA